MTGFRPKPIDDPNFISVVLLTRGRPEILKKSISSLEENTSNKDLVDLWILADDDDTATLNLRESAWNQTIGLPIHWLVGERPPTLNAGLNKVWQLSTNAGIYLHYSDHYLMMTPGWDNLLRRTYDNGPNDRLSVAQIQDASRNSNDLVLWAESAEWANTIGRIVPPYFPYWFGDMWMDCVTTLVQRQVMTTIHMWNMKGKNSGHHGKHQTHSMWNLPFWMRYYNLLLIERIEEAEKILTAIHGAGTEAYRQARAVMETKLQMYEAQATAYDEKRMIQIEKFYSAEKGPPNERYLRSERNAKKHLQVLMPKIKKEKIRRILIYKQQYIENSLTT